jgi:triosephosphate isomerase
MKKLFILGNWKSNKTLSEAKSWLNNVDAAFPVLPEHVTVIVCPNFLALPLFAEKTHGFSVGTQDISPFETGAYTGAIAASMAKEVAAYAMIGHSERRKYFGETDDVVAEKTKRAIAAGIVPVVCVSAVDQVKALSEAAPEFDGKGIFLYEPLFAIGSGTSDSPENADRVAGEIAAVFPHNPILYGGSVTAQNVKGFINATHLSGVGAGGASLTPETFLSLITSVIV